MLNYEFPPLGGGAANANRYLLRELAKRDDLVVDLITSSPDDDRVIDFADNVEIHRLDVSKGDVHYWTQPEIARYSVRAFRLARRLNDEREYDLVHAWFGVPSGVLARFLDVPYLVALRGSDVPGYSERFSAQYVVLRPLIRHVWNRAGAVIANSEGLRELALETADPGIDVIPNGVAVSEFEPDYERDGPLSVLCVARLVERKGIKYLLDAVEPIDDVDVTIVGEGDREAALKRQMEDLGLTDRVTFAGYVPHDDVIEFYERADVFVLPSFNEGMSNTLLEAMAAGLPLVTTDTGGTDELLDGNGTVIEKRDAESIRRALLEYRNDDELRVRHGKRSRQLAEDMSWESVADQYYEVYRELC